MKLSKETISILKNFSSINNSIVFDEEGYVKTRSGGGDGSSTIMAVAGVPEKFPEFCIWDLSKFLGSLSLFNLDEVELTFEGKYIILKEGNQTFKNPKADVGNIPRYKMIPASKIISPGTVFTASFQLPSDMLKTIKKAAGALNSSDKHLKIEVNGNVGKLILTNLDNSGSNIYSRTFESECKKSCSIIIDLDDFKVIEGDYTVEISHETVLKLTNTDLDLTYQIMSIALEDE